MVDVHTGNTRHKQPSFISARPKFIVIWGAGNATIKVVWVDWSVGEFVVIFLE